MVHTVHSIYLMCNRGQREGESSLVGNYLLWRSGFKKSFSRKKRHHVVIMPLPITFYDGPGNMNELKHVSQIRLPRNSFFGSLSLKHNPVALVDLD